MAVTAAQVKELRETTGLGMMDCKKALVETDGDMDAAIELLRKKAGAKASKKAGNIAAEGVVVMATEGNKAVILEANCQTDFVGRGEEFAALAQAAANAALATGVTDIAQLVNEKDENGLVLEERRAQLVAKLGENMTFRRVELIEAAGAIGTYSHGGQIGAVVALTGGDEALAKDVAMHVAASNPQFLNADAVDPAVLEKERNFLIEEAADSGKPREIIEKMVEGRVRKFLAEITLYGQGFVKDPDTTIEKLVKAAGTDVASYVRFQVGEGIEKKEENFAEEVAAQMKAV